MRRAGKTGARGAHLLTMKRPLTAPLFLLLLGACAATDPPRAQRLALRTDGALRAMFHEGATGEVVNLGELLPNPNLYGVGALTELRGEVTIVGGVAHLSWPDGRDGVRHAAVNTTDEGASLLVTAEVGAWREVTTTRRILFEDLDAEVAALATQVGLDPEGRFPFLVEGVVEDLAWHVIDGTRLPAGGGSHEDHLRASVQKVSPRVRATLVGFHSKRDMGVFTHRGSHTHVHAVIAGAGSGHVDHVVLPAGTVVRFPAGS